MEDESLLRYSRQIMLPQVDAVGQQKLLDSHVLIIGAGGLGSPVAMYLAAAGIGTLTLCDDDEVDLSNLQRQILHTTSRIGVHKIDSAVQALEDLNPEISIHPIKQMANPDLLAKLVPQADVVVDASDNFETRFAVNAACVAAKKPLVSGAAIGMDGQLMIYPNDGTDTPCYRCLYPEDGEDALRCSENGVLAPLVGVIGSLQAVETIKLLLGIGSASGGRLLIYDAINMDWRSLRVPRDPACPVCGSKHG